MDNHLIDSMESLNDNADMSYNHIFFCYFIVNVSICFLLQFLEIKKCSLYCGSDTVRC